MTRRARIGTLALLCLAALAGAGCGSQGKTETKADLPERQKAIDASMQKSYGGGK